MKALHVILGGLGAGLVGYLVLKPAPKSAPSKELPPAPMLPKVPVTAKDLGRTLTVDFSDFKMTAFTNAVGKIQLFPNIPVKTGPLRLLGGSIGVDGFFTRVDGSYTFPDGSIAFGSVPPSAVLSMGPAVIPSVPGLPNLEPASLLFPDLAVGDIVVVDIKKANLPSMNGDVLGHALMRVDMILTDKSLVSVATYPIKTFSGTIPRDAIVQRLPPTPPVLNV